MFAVVEGKLVVAISRFESMLRHSYINLIIGGCGGDVCPVNDTACKTRAIERAKVFLPEVAFVRLIVVVPQYLCVVVLDDVCHVTRAAIADFHIVPIEQLVEDVCLRKMFIVQGEERSCNIRLDIFTVRWVKPNDISRSVLASVIIPVFDIYISKILMVAAGFEGIIVGLRGFVEFIRVA